MGWRGRRRNIRGALLDGFEDGRLGYRTVMEFPMDRVNVPDDFGTLKVED